jgi:hypothetical protein
MKCEKTMSDRYLLSCIAIVIFLLTGCAPSATVSQRKCGPISQIYEKGTGIAVWDFEITIPTEDVKMDRFLANRIRKSINKEGHFKLIARDRLYLLLQELNLGVNDLTDEKTRLRLGEIIGAKLMIFGQVFQFPGNTTLINLRLIDIETGLSPSSTKKNYDPGLSSMSELQKTVEEMMPELFQICQ